MDIASPITLRARKLGVLMRDARIAARRSPDDCARAIGVSRGVLRAYEEGRRAPSLPELEILAYYLEGRLPEAVQAFLLQTSFLDRLSGRLLAAIAARDQDAAVEVEGDALFAAHETQEARLLLQGDERAARGTEVHSVRRRVWHRVVVHDLDEDGPGRVACRPPRAGGAFDWRHWRCRSS